MTSTRFGSLALGLILAVRPGCGPFKPDDKEKAQEVQKVPEHCLNESDGCYVGCIERKAGQSCGTCCFEQRIHCNEGQAYDFKKCDTAAVDR